MPVDVNAEWEKAKNGIRSVSQTEQWEKCGYQFYLKRIERAVPRPAAWSHHGTAFHTVAEELEKSGRSMTADQAEDLFSTEYHSLINKSLSKEPNVSLWLSAGRGPAEDIEHRHTLGRQQTRDFVEFVNEKQPKIWTDPNGDKAAELSFVVEFGGVKVRGFIDVVIELEPHKVRPRDYKTGSTKSHFQLQTYGLALRKLYDVEVGDADWYLAKEGRLSRPVKLADVSEDQLADRYGKMDEGVKGGWFLPVPGYHCRFCDVAHACVYKQ